MNAAFKSFAIAIDGIGSSADKSKLIATSLLTMLPANHNDCDLYMTGRKYSTSIASTGLIDVYCILNFIDSFSVSQFIGDTLVRSSDFEEVREYSTLLKCSS